ncbi:MAG: hypothetical protein AAGA62_06035 [Bacteroidota bacterium]
MPTRSSNSQRNNADQRLPEVVDRELSGPVGECLDLSIHPRTEELVDLDSYRVFLKRNLKWQAPPADLLANIHARIDRIKAGEE